MLNKDEEFGLFEIIKMHFPNLQGQSIVMSQNEFLADQNNLKNYICVDRTAQETAIDYIQQKIPYIVMDESEGYKCLFFKGNFLKVQFDVTNDKIIKYIEDFEK